MYYCFIMNCTNRRWLRVLGLACWLAALPAAWGWDSLTFDLPSGSKESLWRDELAREWGGMTEQSIEGGRIDVVTAGEAVEVEFPHKWHEGVGQALHYASATGKQGVLAIIAYAQGEENLRVKSRRRLELIESQCESNGLRLVVLYPSRGEMTPSGAEHRDMRYWLSESGIRHNEDCRYFGKSKNGRMCTPDEGRACKACGG